MTQSDFRDKKNFAETLVRTAIEAADPGRLLAHHITAETDALILGGRRYNPSAVILVSVGKAAVSMAQTIAERLGPRLTKGIVISKAAAAPELPSSLRFYPGSHPVPDERSLQATAAVKKLLVGTQRHELILCTISGGASALLTEPLLPLSNWQTLNHALLASGCTIKEVNTVRQLFDQVKGGGLARWAAPADCMSLILSDVIGSRIAYIGSGPTVTVEKSPEAVKAILDGFQVWEWMDGETAAMVNTHLRQNQSELTVKSSDNQHLIIGDISTATAAVAQKSAEWHFDPTIVSNTLTGEAREIGRMAAEKVKALKPNQCLIWGGESTVTIRGPGQGGRNQEIALAAALELHNAPRCIVIAFSTDAEDGPTPVAGAFVTAETFSDASAKGLDAAQYLANNDSYTFFDRLGWGHLTAERGTNVNDVLVAIRF